MKGGKVAKTVVRISAQIRKTIAGFLVFVDFHVYYTEPGSPQWGLLEGEGLFVREQLKGEG